MSNNVVFLILVGPLLRVSRLDPSKFCTLKVNEEGHLSVMIEEGSHYTLFGVSYNGRSLRCVGNHRSQKQPLTSTSVRTGVEDLGSFNLTTMYTGLWEKDLV